MSKIDYHIVVSPLTEELGGGYVAFVPDLPGCMADGETTTEALENLHDAIDCWVLAQDDRGGEMPAPGSAKDCVREAIENHEDIAAKQNELISVQKRLIKSLQSRCNELETEREIASAGWRPTVMFENPATSGNKGRLRVAMPAAPTEADVIPIHRD